MSPQQKKRYSIDESYTESDGGGSIHHEESEEGDEQLGLRETMVVNGSKVCVYLVLLFACIIVAVVTFRFIEREEREDFEADVSILLEPRVCCFALSI